MSQGSVNSAIRNTEIREFEKKFVLVKSLLETNELVSENDCNISSVILPELFVGKDLSSSVDASDCAVKITCK